LAHTRTPGASVIYFSSAVWVRASADRKKFPELRWMRKEILFRMISNSNATRFSRMFGLCWRLRDREWENLVDVTVFLTNMKKDFPVFNKIYAEYFKENQPCRTTIEINALPTPIAIELKCIATLD
jgi:hypothetical protein